MEKTLFVFLFMAQTILFGQKFSVSGYLTSLNTGDYLVNALLNIDDSLKIVSDETGSFYLKLSKGKHRFKVLQVGYEPFERTIEISADTNLIFALTESPILLKSVNVTAKRTDINKFVIKPETVLDLPFVLGEKDVLKNVVFYPGFTQGNEGTTNFFVRGSEAGNNLIIFDGIPLYNTYHIWGFLSFINPQIIKTIKIYKGGFPPEYSGRSAAVIDVYSKEGNYKATKKYLSLGMLSGNFYLETPVIKDKLSLLIAFRRSFLDLIIFPIYSLFSEQKSYFYFYDFNFKIAFSPKQKRKLYLSVYSSKDKIQTRYNFNDDNSSNFIRQEFRNYLFWQNNGVSLRYFLGLSKRSNLKFTFFANSYGYKSNFRQNTTLIRKLDPKDTIKVLSLKETSSKIDDFGAKFTFRFAVNSNWVTKTGAKIILHQFYPVNLHSLYSDSYADIRNDFNSTDFIRAKEFAAFFQNEINYDFFKTKFGVVWNNINSLDTFYSFFEPRINLELPFNKNFRIQTSYAKSNQFVQLLTSSNLNLPTDIWLPITKKILPTESNIYDFGFVLDQKNRTFSLSVYYKQMNNILRHKQGSNLFNPSVYWEDNLILGNGYSYGAEFFFLLKNSNKEFSLSYTYSRSWRIFEIDGQKEKFPFKFDRPHNLNLIFKYKLNSSSELTADFVFMSGINFTLYDQLIPVYIYENINFADYYDEINKYRLPPYHRLDISYNKKIVKKSSVRTFSLGVYNVYNRRNPYFVNVVQIDNEVKLEGVCLFPFMPFVSYSVSF